VVLHENWLPNYRSFYGMRDVLVAGVFCVFSIALMASALAQSSNSKTNPAQIEQRLEDRVRREQLKKADPSLPTLSQEAVIGDTRPLFVLKKVRVDFGQIVKLDGIAQTYHAYLGRRVSVADLSKIAHKITEIYRSAGYFLTRAIVPPQDVENGQITVRVIPGSIVRVSIKGDKTHRIDFKPYIDRLVAHAPSKMADFERQLLLMNDVYGLAIKDTTLKELGVGSGRFVLTVTVEFTERNFFASLDNRGTKDVGRLQALAYATQNSLTGVGDSLTLAGSTIPDTPREYKFVRLAYQRPIGATGLKTGGFVSYSDLEPSGDDRALGVEKHTITYNFFVEAALIRSRDITLRTSLILRAQNYVEDNNAGKVARDKTRTVTASANYNYKDFFDGRSNINVQGRLGLDILNASEKNDPFLSNSDGRGDFTKINFNFFRSQPLGEYFEITASASGQKGFDALLSSEEFYIGGGAYGRAFDGGEFSGDSGLAGALEFRFKRSSSLGWLNSYQIYAFLDGGKVWNHNTTQSNSLSSSGVGTRIYLKDGLYLNAELAFKLSQKPRVNFDKSARGFFYVSKSF